MFRGRYIVRCHRRRRQQLIGYLIILSISLSISLNQSICLFTGEEICLELFKIAKNHGKLEEQDWCRGEEV